MYNILYIMAETDRDISEKWMARAKTLQGRDVNVLKHRNNFTKYLLGLIRDTIAETGQTPTCCAWGVSIGGWLEGLGNRKSGRDVRLGTCTRTRVYVPRDVPI